MTTPADQTGSLTGTTRTRTDVLDAGRAAAIQRRRSDSERCRRDVLAVLAAMRKNRTPLSNAEITRRAGVNPQFLQRHHDLRAEADAVRAHLADDRPRAAAAASARKEAALETENKMLLEQNAALRRAWPRSKPSCAPPALTSSAPAPGTAFTAHQYVTQNWTN